MNTTSQQNNKRLNTIDEIPNSLPLKDIHSSWISSLPHGKLLNELLASNIATEIVEKRIRKKLGLLDIQPVNQDSLAGRINSLRSDSLESLVMKAGVVQLSKTIKQAIMAEDIKELKEALGVDLYNFAIFEGSTFYPLLPAFENNISMSKDILINVINSGYHTIFIALNNSPKNQILFKLPKTLHDAHSSIYDKHSSEKNEQVFHTTLIDNIITAYFKTSN